MKKKGEIVAHQQVPGSDVPTNVSFWWWAMWQNGEGVALMTFLTDKVVTTYFSGLILAFPASYLPEGLKVGVGSAI